MNEFAYRPREGVAQNEIRENAAGHVFITEPVAHYITNAVRRELRQAGVSLRRGGAGCVLDGVISDFAMESQGYNATFISDIRYTLRQRGGEVLFDQPVQVSFTTDKFVAPAILLASVQKLVSDNVGRFLSHPTVVSRLSSRCNVVVAPQA